MNDQPVDWYARPYEHEWSEGPAVAEIPARLLDLLPPIPCWPDLN